MTQSFEEDLTAETLTAQTPAPETPATETQTVPDAMVASFSSLTTAYCWVITEDLYAGYDGAEPSAVGQYGPSEAAPGDVQEALRTGKWFRLAGPGEGAGDTGLLPAAGFAVGRIYDPSGENAAAPLDEVGPAAWVASSIEYRQGGQWEPWLTRPELE